MTKIKTCLDYRLMDWDDAQRELKILALKGALAWKRHLRQKREARLIRPPLFVPEPQQAALWEGADER